jgi:Ca2+-binding RTX toxin-like protein
MNKKQRQAIAQRKLNLERLERREVFAASMGLESGALTITADPGGSQVVVTDTAPYSSTGMLFIQANSTNGENWSTAIPKSAVSRIHFEGSGAADSFNASTVGLTKYLMPIGIGYPIQVTANGNGSNDSLTGGIGNDVLDGGSGNDSLTGRGGNDTLSGGSGNDYIYGDGNSFSADVYSDSGDTRTASSYSAGGTDTLRGGSGIDRLYGGGGNDTLQGDGEVDYLYGNHGNDTVHGGFGDDNLYGQVGDDLLQGQEGSDYIVGAAGNDFMEGDKADAQQLAPGNDTLAGGDGQDILSGGSGNDTLHGDAGNDTVWGGNGDDRLVGGDGVDDLYGGAGADALYGDSDETGAAFAGSGDDKLWGDAGDDKLFGSWGNDSLYGGDGNDNMDGESGDDVLRGDTGRDRMFGGWGNDALLGGLGDDRLSGDWGRDTLQGEGGNDELIGGNDIDYLYGGTGDDTLVAIDMAGGDQMFGNDGRDTFWVDGATDIRTTDSLDTVQTVVSFANTSDGTLNGDKINDPTDGANYKDFSSNWLFADVGPTQHDIDQGAAANCGLMATMAGVAHDNPHHIRKIVADFGDGTYGVRLGNNFYRVDGDLPTWDAASTDQVFAGLGQQSSLWAAVIEKAYTLFRTGANTYASLNWGWGGNEVHQAFGLSGVNFTYHTAASSDTDLANTVFSRWNSYQNTVICTGAVSTTSNLVGSHCYSVDSVNLDSAGNVISIVLRNPWGPDDTGGDPFVTLTPAQLGSCEIWVDYATVV